MVSDLLLDNAGGVEKEGLYAIVSINVERKLCGPGLLGKGGHVGFGKSSHNVIWDGLVAPNYTVIVQQLHSIGFLLLTDSFAA